jgi:hypothetical protein
VDAERTVRARLHRGAEDPGELRTIVADVDRGLGEATGGDQANVDGFGEVEPGGLDDWTEMEEWTVHDWGSAAWYFDIKILHLKASCQES